MSEKEHTKIIINKTRKPTLILLRSVTTLFLLIVNCISPGLTTQKLSITI